MMALPTVLEGALSASSEHLEAQQIPRLVQTCLVGRKIDAVAFLEEVLAIATRVGAVSCSPLADRGLRVDLAGCDPIEVELDGSRGKLRMLCARLAVLCKESGHEFMPYGGQGTIRRTVKVVLGGGENEPLFYVLAWQARWTNTPGQHEFTLSVTR